MKRIKTIWWDIQRAEDFDCAVNNAIEDGWQLVCRMVLMPKNEVGYPLLYAELEREDVTVDGLCGE